jgi:O-antigen ligase
MRIENWLSRYLRVLPALNTAILLGGLLVYIVLGATWYNLVTIEYRIMALVTVAAVCVGWLVLRGRGQWHHTSLDGVLSFWAVAFGVSLLANLDAWRRIGIGLWFAGLYILLWYILHDGLANKRLSRQLLVDSLLVGGIAILGAGYAELFRALRINPASLPRVRSILENPNPLATALLVLTPLAIARCFTLRGWLRIIMSVYALLSAVMLILTVTRGAWVAAGTALPILLWLLALHYGVRINRYAVIGLAGIATVAFLAVTAARGWQLGGRDEIYTVAIKMFTEKPISGYGLFTFGRGLLRIVGVLPAETTHSQAHNIVLNIAAELGTVGLIALAATLAVLFRQMWLNWRLAAGHERILIAGAIAAVVGFGVHHLFDVTASLPAVAFMGLLALVVAVAPVAAEVTRPSRLRPILLGGLMAVVLLAGAWDAVIYRMYLAGLGDTIRGNIDAAVQKLVAASDADPAMPVYQLHRAILLDVAGQGEAARRAFEALCRLEPYYAAAPYDTHMARLHFFSLSLITQPTFWFVYDCQSPAP